MFELARNFSKRSRLQFSRLKLQSNLESTETCDIPLRLSRQTGIWYTNDPITAERKDK